MAVSPADYRAALARLGLTLLGRDAQQALGASKSTLQRWAKDGPTPTGARLVEALLRERAATEQA